MITVTAEEFFNALRASSADIMPSVTHSPPWDSVNGYVSTWANQRTGEVVGKSFGVGEHQTYQLTASFLNEKE